MVPRKGRPHSGVCARPLAAGSPHLCVTGLWIFQVLQAGEALACRWGSGAASLVWVRMWISILYLLRGRWGEGGGEHGSAAGHSGPLPAPSPPHPGVEAAAVAGTALPVAAVAASLLGLHVVVVDVVYQVLEGSKGWLHCEARNVLSPRGEPPARTLHPPSSPLTLAPATHQLLGQGQLWRGHLSLGVVRKEEAGRCRAPPRAQRQEELGGAGDTVQAGAEAGGPGGDRRQSRSAAARGPRWPRPLPAWPISLCPGAEQCPWGMSAPTWLYVCTGPLCKESVQM